MFPWSSLLTSFLNDHSHNSEILAELTNQLFFQDHALPMAFEEVQSAQRSEGSFKAMEQTPAASFLFFLSLAWLQADENDVFDLLGPASIPQLHELLLIAKRLCRSLNPKP